MKPRTAIIIVVAIVLAGIVAGVLVEHPSLLNSLPVIGRHSASSQPQPPHSANPPAPTTQPSSSGAPASPSASASASHSPRPSGSPGASNSPHPKPQPSPGTVCVNTLGWNRGPKATRHQVRVTAPIVAASPGIHDNCDRLVLIFSGSHPPNAVVKLGVRAQYGPRVDNHPTIRLAILAPSKLRVKNGYSVSPAQLKGLGTKAATFKELRWVKPAGSSKGQTVLTVSVLHEHPFRIDSYVDDQGHLLVILDIAALAHGNAPSPAPSGAG